MLVKFDRQARKVRVSCRAEELLKILQAPEDAGEKCDCLWRPEFGSYMVEGTPGEPYGIERSALERIWIRDAIKNDDEIMKDRTVMTDGFFTDTDMFVSRVEDNSILFSFLNGVESNMRLRRKEVQKYLSQDEAVLTISTFPMLGTFDFCNPPAFVDPTQGYAESLFFPDQGLDFKLL